MEKAQERRSIPLVALRIVESALGPFLVDDDIATGPSRLELLALSLNLDPDTLRELLRAEIQERRRERSLALGEARPPGREVGDRRLGGL